MSKLTATSSRHAMHGENGTAGALFAGERAALRALLGRFAPLFVLMALGLGIGALNHDFFDPMNLARIAIAAVIPLTIALGGTFVIQLGSIDLSAEGIVAVAAIGVSMLVENSFNGNQYGLWAVAVGIVAGVLLGLTNGVLHVALRIPSFITTLAVGFVATGIGTAVLSGNTIRVSDMALRSISITRYAGLPLSVWIAVVALGLAYFVHRHTVLGRHALSIGGGEDLARLNGVRVARIRIAVFALAGAFYGLAGILAVAQYGQGHAMIANGQLFVAITAIVVGGTSLAGGNGGPLNTLIGTLVVVVLANGMVLLGVPPYVQQGIQGVLIIAAVTLALNRSRRRIVK
ncbi:ABC transporter permease [Paraburkholderia sp. JPY432]|uniref:ABC transporter permease n=1 Tax=Paraburkholderia youngii TaxID=2782701 RepID=UPI001595E611|nr:ABC transporter permease [Paraburkholderia youngii]NVH74100.1 ABC transporter permease [Paraburkholderia youngii]